MSFNTIRSIVTRFVKDGTANVLVIKGAWGVGKTHAWREILKENKGNILFFKNYCYVSLFGISSMAELKTTIFSKTQQITVLEEKISFKVLNQHWATLASAKTKEAMQGLSKFINELPYGKNLTIGIESIAPHFMRDMIICLDDFERLDPKLVNHEELLGFISELKEEKNCKIILIFNEKALSSKAAYDKYKEKVVDIELYFNLTSLEAFELACPLELPNREDIKKCIISLDINNIRILRKISDLVLIIHKEIGHLHDTVMKQAINTLVLFTWCAYDNHDDKPSTEFILKWNSFTWAMGLDSQAKKEAKQIVWAQKLQQYGILNIDKFDLSILNVIKCGYTDETGLLDYAKEVDSESRVSDEINEFRSTINLIYETFLDNESTIIEQLTYCVRNSARYISPNNLNSAIIILRQLDQNTLADSLIDYYIEARKLETRIFDLKGSLFSRDINDPVLIERFNKKYDEIETPPALYDVVKTVADNNAWSSRHLEVLSKATVSDFEYLFQSKHGSELARLIRACLQFESFENSPEYTLIGQNAHAALVKIGQKNRLNALRVRNFGIPISISQPSSSTSIVEESADR
ncbi:MAG: hypothetical protein Q7S87_13870 [Agitococcus sp.]|nr:hypothetical protein [Agitococcus sp.]